MAGQRRVEELEKLLREAELRAESLETRRLEEQQRAEKERQRAEEERQRAEIEQRRADASEEQTRLTTLREYIEACHTLVFSKLIVERDRSLTSKGSITNPKNKLCQPHSNHGLAFFSSKDSLLVSYKMASPQVHVFSSPETYCPALATEFPCGRSRTKRG